MAAKVALKKIVEVSILRLLLTQLSEVPALGTSKIASKLSIFDGDMASLKIQCMVNDVDPDFKHPRFCFRVSFIIRWHYKCSELCWWS